MKITKLIEKLQEIYRKDGDLNVVVDVPNSDFFHDVINASGKDYSGNHKMGNGEWYPRIVLVIEEVDES